jgi:hypothetical protein
VGVLFEMQSAGRCDFALSWFQTAGRSRDPAISPYGIVRGWPTFAILRLLRNSKLKSHIVFQAVANRKILRSKQIKSEFRNNLILAKVGTCTPASRL